MGRTGRSPFSEIPMSRSLLARTAAHLYWAGRYIERAEDMARLVLVHGDAHVDLPVGEDVGWRPLLAVAGVEGAFAEHLRWTNTARPVGEPSEQEVIDFLLCSRDNPTSILASVESAREVMRSARPAIPREAWELCNSLLFRLKDHCNSIRSRRERVGWLRQVISDGERLNGALWAAMSRDSAMAFTRVGQNIERADLTLRVLSVRVAALVDHDDAEPFGHVRAMAVLRSLAAQQSFRRSNPAHRGSGAMLRFLIQDESFPRSVAACLSEIREQLKELPHNEDAVATCSESSVQIAGINCDALSAAGLCEFASALQALLRALHQRIESAWFPSSVTPPYSSDIRVTSARQTRQEDPQGWSEAAVEPGYRQFRVAHRTVYRYEEVAEQSYNEAHLRPRDTSFQRRLNYQLKVEPEPTGWSEHLDVFGNDVVTFVVRGAFDVLTVDSLSEIELVRAPEPPPGMPWESVRTLLDTDRQETTRRARRFRTPSRLVPVSAELEAYALASFSPNRSIVAAVRELASRIHEDFRYEPGLTSVTTPVLEVFGDRRGVCQDFAHIAVGSLRSIGLAARYVSGYIESARTSSSGLIGTEASHAWVSTYLPSWGWLDFDPTNNQFVKDGHVTTAWGRDYGDVSPLRGSVVGGGRAHSLEVTVEMTDIAGHQ